MRFAILLSISRISLLAIFFRIPDISNSRITASFSFLSFCTACGLSGSTRPSSTNFLPLDTLLLCFFPWSVKSGKVAWKPWKSE